MMVYVVHQLAKEINGDFVSSMIEMVSLSRETAEKYATEHQLAEPVIKIEDHMCRVIRTIVPSEVVK